MLSFYACIKSYKLHEPPKLCSSFDLLQTHVIEVIHKKYISKLILLDIHYFKSQLETSCKYICVLVY